ncbi:hypothetical protein CCAX7_006300 [Capsulimonas corticalis]|uniref:DUF4328 domain-containing protein n=1 Tax=Capsulimonas corticalis TaxID=2219043 RepID=A0A402D3L6_9BACT|nr:DUF4328 domain-containing protein [Capsulimonas corticalis]BDI28579.1 hypothetical protein CCAX7_006300 [Capsulimonas corticalis]
MSMPPFPPSEAIAPVVWPPPPTNTANVLTDEQRRAFAQLSKYQSPIALSHWIVGSLAITFVVQFAQTACLLLGPAAAKLESITSDVSAFTAMAGGMFFLIWIRQLYQNLTFLGVPGLQYSPMSAATAFLIPIVSIYKPIKIMAEIWKATSPSSVLYFVSGHWAQTPSTPLITAWWALFTIYNSINFLIALNMDISQFKVINDEADLLFSAINGALLAILILRLTKREESRYREIYASLQN